MARDRDTAINSYITDMLALEDHIEKALKSQLTDLKDYPDVTSELRTIHQSIQHHISDLNALSDRRKAGGPRRRKLDPVKTQPVAPLRRRGRSRDRRLAVRGPGETEAAEGLDERNKEAGQTAADHACDEKQQPEPPQETQDEDSRHE